MVVTKKVNYFGIRKNNDNDKLREQVEVLYYNNKDNFAIKIKTKQEDEVMLCKNPKGNTFNEMYQKILTKKKNNYSGSKVLEEKEILKKYLILK